MSGVGVAPRAFHGAVPCMVGDRKTCMMEWEGEPSDRRFDDAVTCSSMCSNWKDTGSSGRWVN